MENNQYGQFLHFSSLHKEKYVRTQEELNKKKASKFVLFCRTQWNAYEIRSSEIFPRGNTVKYFAWIRRGSNNSHICLSDQSWGNISFRELFTIPMRMSVFLCTSKVRCVSIHKCFMHVTFLSMNKESNEIRELTKNKNIKYQIISDRKKKVYRLWKQKKIEKVRPFCLSLDGRSYQCFFSIRYVQLSDEGWDPRHGQPQSLSRVQHP